MSLGGHFEVKAPHAGAAAMVRVPVRTAEADRLKLFSDALLPT